MVAANQSEPLEHDGSTLWHDGASPENDDTTLEHDGLVLHLTLMDQVKSHVRIPKSRAIVLTDRSVNLRGFENNFLSTIHRYRQA